MNQPRRRWCACGAVLAHTSPPTEPGRVFSARMRRTAPPWPLCSSTESVTRAQPIRLRIREALECMIVSASLVSLVQMAAFALHAQPIPTNRCVATAHACSALQTRSPRQPRRGAIATAGMRALMPISRSFPYQPFLVPVFLCACSFWSVFSLHVLTVARRGRAGARQR